MADETSELEPGEGYEPPRVEDVPAQDGPAVTAAGDSPDDERGPEWRPGADRRQASES